MINRALKNYGSIPNIEFQVRDVCDLQFTSQSFDVAISQRCLINLESWEKQQRALEQIAQVVKPDGCFFMQEGTRQGRERLNCVRELFGLKRMPEVPFNLDFDEELLWPFISKYFTTIEVRRFGLFDLISRVVHPLLVYPEEPKYDAEINAIAWRISAKLRGSDEISREFSAFLRRLPQ
jgi:SAM-dependent methyltransferase